MKVREVVRILERDGWVMDRMKGDHRQFVHPAKRGTVTVPGKMGDEITPGTLHQILSKSELKGANR